MVDGAGGHLAPEQVRAAVAPHAYYKSDLQLVVLENTHNLGGGTVQALAEQRAVIAAARELRAQGPPRRRAHLERGHRARRRARGAGGRRRHGNDLSLEGLGAPAGSLVASTRERIVEARRIRKLLGGGMRQAGVLAAAGLVALETLVPRLAEDHANARLLGEAFAKGRGVRLAPVETNIVVGVLEGRSAPEAVASLREKGVLGAAMDAKTLRFTTHRDVSRADCERAAEIIEKTLR